MCVLKVNQSSAQLISGSWDARAVVFNLNDLIYGKEPKVSKNLRKIVGVEVFFEDYKKVRVFLTHDF